MTIRFYSKTAGYSWLSNFSDDGFIVNGVRWPSVEHYYQAHKFSGTEIFRQVQQAVSALKAKKMGETHADCVRGDWVSMKEAIMRKALQAKFLQNDRLRKLLLETGEEELEHESSTDLYWGRTESGEGENRLGVLLMELRAALRDMSREH